MRFELEQFGKRLLSNRIQDELKALNVELRHCRTMRDEPDAYGVQGSGMQADANESATMP